MFNISILVELGMTFILYFGK